MYNELLQHIKEKSDAKLKLSPDNPYLFSELIRDIKLVLNQLYKDKKIHISDTVNDKYLKPYEDK